MINTCARLHNTLTNEARPWTMCNACRDVHRESDRITKPWALIGKGAWLSHCPQCNATLQAPRATIPRQHELFSFGATAPQLQPSLTQ